MQIMTADWAAQLDDIADRYAAGETTAAIAKVHNISPATVLRWRRHPRISARVHVGYEAAWIARTASVDDIAARHARGETIASIAETHGITQSAVRRRLAARQPADAQPGETVIQSRDGQWLYSVGACGYIVDVLHRPTGRTTHVRGGLPVARRMAKSGELLALVERIAEGSS